MRRAALLLAALSLAGPGVDRLGAQDVGTPAARGPQSRAREAARDAAMPQAAGFWRMLDDPVLDRLVAEALSANPDLGAVEARVAGARAERFQSVLDLAPVVTASGGYTRQRISGASFPGLDGRLPDQEFWEAGVLMSWELDAFGRLRRTLEGRSALADAATEDVRDTRVLLAAEVAERYFRLLGDEDRLAVARRNAENQRRTLDLTIERLEGGQGTAVDMERARAQLSATLAAIPALESSIAAARHRIAVLVGREPGAEIEALADVGTPAEIRDAAEIGDPRELEAPGATTRLPSLPVDLAIPEVDALVRRRPDILGAERRLMASAAFVGAARAEYLPRVTIGGAAGYTAGAFDDIGGSGTWRYAVGPVISWPLFDLGRVKAKVDAAESEESAAERRYRATVLRALEEVETSLVAYRRARERLEHLEGAAVASERATELARLRFEGGAADFLEVLDAERTQLENQDRLSAGRTEAATALVVVFRALGGAWPGEGDGSP